MRLPLILAASTAAAAVLLVGNDEFPSHAECALFTEKGASMRRQASLDGTRAGYRQSNLTVQVTGLLAGPNRIIPGGSRTDIYQQYDQLGPIDSQIFKAMADAGVT